MYVSADWPCSIELSKLSPTHLPPIPTPISYNPDSNSTFSEYITVPPAPPSAIFLDILLLLILFLESICPPKLPPPTSKILHFIFFNKSGICNIYLVILCSRLLGKILKLLSINFKFKLSLSQKLE